LETLARSSPQAQQTTPAGKNGSPDTPTLNPLFVEALMGWPPAWTDCEHAVTGLSLWQQRMRGELLRLG
jgi:DNA (cytosine-5)-methyltransferase 1